MQTYRQAPERRRWEQVQIFGVWPCYAKTAVLGGEEEYIGSLMQQLFTSYSIALTQLVIEEARPKNDSNNNFVVVYVCVCARHNVCVHVSLLPTQNMSSRGQTQHTRLL